MARATDDLDYALALSLQDQFDQEDRLLKKKHEAPVEVLDTIYDPKSIVDQRWELDDPNPNIHDLFVQFDAMFFNRTLTSSGVAVRWSHRMTLCAGTCTYEGRGGLCSINLSHPLLKLRPRRDLVETLLHEMIHAYLFVTQNNTDHDGHGPQFQSHMHRINHLTGAKITIYHSFHEEVNVYKQHWWKCNGPCQHRPPFFGIVKRAMNRAPSPKDYWWEKHQRMCGGTYTKIKEPEGYGESKSQKRNNGGSVGKAGGGGDKGRDTGSRNIKDMFKKTMDDSTGQQLPSTSRPSSSSDVSLFVGSGHKLSNEDSGSSSSTLRTKMLEAVEKRMQVNKQRGVAGTKRKISSSGLSKGNHDIRDFTSGSSDSRSAAKRPKLSSTDLGNDCIILDLESSTSSQVASPCNRSPQRSAGESGSNNAIIDLSKDPHEEHPTQCDTDFISLDDSDEDTSGLKMCPVCGRTDIPTAIINAHVAFCLDEVTESALDDYL